MLKSFAGGRVFGGTWGSGVPTVLALHGWGRTHHDFSAVFDDRDDGEVAAAVSVVGPDLFGFGATPPPPEPWGSDEYARQLLPLFDERGVLAERVVVVGHSFGGRVAVRLNALVPDRIERMVLCSVPLLDRQGRRARPAVAYRVVRRLHGIGLVGAERMEAARNRYGSPDYRAAQGMMRGVLVKLMAEHYTEDMAAIGCPVHLVWGEADTDVPVDVAVRAREIFPRSTLTVLPGIGHLVPTEAPRALRAAVLGMDPEVRGLRPAAIDDDPMAGSR